MGDEVFPGERDRTIAWLRERGRVPTPWTVIVEAASWDEAVRLAEQALMNRGCNQLVPYDQRIGKHPDTGNDAWHISIAADCAEVRPEDYPVRPARVLVIQADGTVHLE